MRAFLIIGLVVPFLAFAAGTGEAARNSVFAGGEGKHGYVKHWLQRDDKLRRLYFYHGHDYGTQANYHPLNPIINGGFGIWQVAPYCFDRKLIEFPYAESFDALWENIHDPFDTVKRFGVKRFLLTEVIPASGDINNSQFWPNWGLHLIGAGVHYRETEEWYRYHKIPYPRMLSVATMYAYHFLTEMVENGGAHSLTVDPVADMFIFDPLSLLLFSNDRVCGFFADKMHIAEWSMQPAYNPVTGNLENMGQFYAAKVPFTSDGRWSVFGHAGLHEMVGLSRKVDAEHWVTGSFGMMVENIVKAEQDGEGTALTATFTWSAGVFYDRNNSLLASLTVSGVPHNRVRMNVYPGIIKLGPVSPGLFFAYTGEAIAGLTLRYLPIGLAGTMGN